MNKEILRLALPNIISNVSIPLLSTVDTALMGRLSELHLGAVGVGAMIFNFLYWNFGFLRMGTTGITAQAFGQNNRPSIILTLSRALFIAWVTGLLLIILQIPLQKASVFLMNVQQPQAGLVIRYFSIRIWAAPATLSLYALLGWFFGMQNALYPLFITVGINVLNIVMSFVLVQYYGMGVEGVAYGTVAAQYFGLLLATALFFYRYSPALQNLVPGAVLAWQALKQFLGINTDIFIRTICLSFAFAFFYSQSATLDPTILAVNVILLQFLNWMSYGIDGFAFASESLVGKYAGAANKPKLLQAIRLSFYWGMALALGYSLVYGVFGQPLLHIFTNQQGLILSAVPFLWWMTVFPLLSTPCYIWDGVFIGLTASKEMRNSMLLALAIYLLAYWLLTPIMGNHGLWLALLLFMVARGAIQWAMFGKGMVSRQVAPQSP